VARAAQPTFWQMIFFLKNNDESAHILIIYNFIQMQISEPDKVYFKRAKISVFCAHMLFELSRGSQLSLKVILNSAALPEDLSIHSIIYKDLYECAGLVESTGRPSIHLLWVPASW